MPPLQGLRVLVVEDELLVALFVTDILEDAGATVIGPHGTVAAALAAAATGTFDTALLDVNIGREMVFPVVEALERRGIPHVFVTGYGTSVLPPRSRGRPAVAKPYRGEDVVEALRASVLGADADC